MPVYRDPALFPEAMDDSGADSTFLAFAEGTITWPSLALLSEITCSCGADCSRDHERE